MQEPLRGEAIKIVLEIVTKFGKGACVAGDVDAYTRWRTPIYAIKMGQLADPAGLAAH